MNRFFSDAELNTLGADKAKCELAETIMRDNRNRVEAYMLEKTGQPVKRHLIRIFENAIVRLAGSKSPAKPDKSFVTGVSGKWDEEKANTVYSKWICHCVSKVSTLKDMIADLKLEDFVEDDDDGGKDTKSDGSKKKSATEVLGSDSLILMFGAE